MTGVRNPIYIETWYNLSTKPKPSEATAAEVTAKTPAFRDILIQNVKSTGTPYNKSAKAYFPIYIYGLPESPVKNVTLDNVQVEAQKGMFLAYVDGLTFKNGCKVTNTKDKNKLLESTNYEVNNLTGDYTGATSGIADINTNKQIQQNNIYDLAGNLIKEKASSEDLQGLKKGIYIYNNKKYVAK